MSSSTAIVKIEEFLAPAAMQKEEMELFKEDDLQIESFPNIKIVHAAQMFQMPDDTTKKDFAGIILYAQRANAYWGQTYEESGGGEAPDCSSMDAIKPDFGEDIQCGSCSSCRQNKPGSNPNGRKWSRACKNMYRLFIMMNGNQLPCRLIVPPTSLKSVSDYIVEFKNKGRAYQCGLAIFSLSKKDTYSILKISSAKDESGEPVMINDQEGIKKVLDLYKKFLPIMKKVPIAREEGEE